MCNYFADCDCKDHYDEGHHVVSPAYGRDYKNAKEARKDWFDGKDFVYECIGRGGGRYCSKRDFGPNEQIEIRFNRKTDLTMVGN